MRRKKHKHTRRAVSFYKLSYGFHEPYKVLLDGNFVHAAITSNLANLGEHIPRLIGGRCKLYVTRCVTHELQELGPEFKQALTTARGYELHKCGHTPGECSASDCIKEQIGTRNPDHWWVATQDKALRSELARVPGCPCVFATVNGIHLESPPEMAKAVAKQAEGRAAAVPRHEKHTDALAGVDLGALDPARVRTNVAFRRNKAKGPNPLAVRKKGTKKVAASGGAKEGVVKSKPQAVDADAGGGGVQDGGKAKRKRTRNGSKPAAESAAS